MFAIGDAANVVAVVGESGAGEIESASIGGADHLDSVGIVDLIGRAARGKGSNFHFRSRHGLKQGVEMLGPEQGLVALDIDVDIGGNGLGNRMDAIRATGAVLGSENGRKVVLLSEGKN